MNIFISIFLKWIFFLFNEMGRPLVTACVFCLLCATPSHCSSSHHGIKQTDLNTPPYSDSSGLKAVDNTYGNSGLSILPEFGRLKRHQTDNEEFITNVFKQFGNGDTMNREGFEKLLESLGLSQTSHEYHRDDAPAINSTSNNNTNHNSSTEFSCLTSTDLIGESKIITKESYKEICPQILHYLVPNKENEKCYNHIHDHGEADDHDDHSIQIEPTNQTAVWVYASLSVVLISLCGLLVVVVIPLMHKTIYHSLLQFLVALAVGTLCGDALLHLLPHAMMSSNGHGHGSHSHSHGGSGSSDNDQHSVNLWRGLVAALAIAFFYVMEKFLSFVAKWRKKRHHAKKVAKTRANTKVRVMRDDGLNSDDTNVGEKLCKHKYSSYPYCYGEIAENPEGHHGHGESEINSIATMKEEHPKSILNNKISDMDKEDISEKQLLNSGDGPNEKYTTIILREHETQHHGHAHTHGHVHSAPGSLGSVAWMVVMGDGLHNFTDGLAIGAAFAANIGGGVSTAVAVFCHELPHELGDFAVLIKAGMSFKQAIFYNMLSSVLCFIGMCCGIFLGHNDTTTLWVFSAAAGMFLYIALVDMIPELTSSHAQQKSSLCQCFLQVAGLLTGISIMLLIALYEHDLRDSFKNTF